MKKTFKLPKDRKGYQYYKDKEGNKKRVHSRVAEKKYGKIPKGFHIHHMDNNKDNNRPSNLILLHKKDHYKVHKGKLIINK